MNADTFPYDVVALAMLLLLNRTLAPSLRANWSFWSFQAVNIAAAAYFAWFGIEGVEHVPVASYIVAALCLFHVVQNVIVRQRQAPPR